MSCVTNLCYQISQTRLENKLKKLIFQVGKAVKPRINGGATRDRTADLVTAVFDSMIQKPEKKNDKICPPGHTLQLNLKVIVNKYLKENPGSLPFNADDSASIAIWMAFPCPDRDP